MALWRHQMEAFSSLLALCVGNSPVTGEFPSQRPVTWSFDVFFDPRLNKRLSKQSWGWWFETPSSPLWRQCNGPPMNHTHCSQCFVISVVIQFNLKLLHSHASWILCVTKAPSWHRVLLANHLRHFSEIRSPICVISNNITAHSLWTCLVATELLYCN